MPSKYALNVSLTEHLCDFVAAQVASGRFGTASEVVRAGLRLLEKDERDLARRPDGSDGADPNPPTSMSRKLTEERRIATPRRVP
ncbi:MAG TPA: type II toxin-antitoxin system ParD family antitoxin [Lichenihabitans sp.]|jgi:antitoxin ParD1/3/4|nr:type II toxin-antitoxin system ParD family antitoxin [Lichenihabitans sp.]